MGIVGDVRNPSQSGILDGTCKCDLVPHWDCVESNKGSIGTVESVGFERIKERPFYWFAI